MDLNLDDLDNTDLNLEELGDFTLDELGELTLDELTLPIDELLSSLNERNASIPVQTYEKLMNLYNDIKSKCETNLESETNIDPFPKLDTISNQIESLGKIISVLYTLYGVLNDDNIRNMIYTFFKLILDLLNH